MRHPGSVVDVQAKTVRDRDAVTHPLDRLEHSAGVLYHARHFDHPRFDYHERWIFEEQGWVLNRFRWLVEPDLDWYLETEIIRRDAHCWTVEDGLLDVWLFDGLRYRVDDADELADAIARGHISLDEGLEVLRNFQSLERALRDAEFSGIELLRRHAPGLAHFETPDRNVQPKAG